MTVPSAVVTGAAGGIGAVVARCAAEAGYRVRLWDADDVGAKAVARAIGEGAVSAHVDVTDERSVEQALALLEEPPRLLVNCAGINRAGALLDVDVLEWRRVLDVNLTGTFLCARAVARSMIGRGGAIVNTASVGALAPIRNTGAYSASKAAIVRLTEQMALEWAPHDIRVNAVAPGLIDAGMSRASNLAPELVERRHRMIPLGRAGTAEDIAAAVLFLGSDAAAYITGETLAVDGALSRIALASLPTAYDPA